MNERLERHIGAGLLVRPVQGHDATEVFALVASDRRRLSEWLPWVDATDTVQDAVAFVRAATDQLARDDGAQFVIVEDERIAGVVGFHGIDWRNRATSLGYWLGAPFEGRGLATRSVAALLELAFVTWMLHRVEIRAAPGNTRSRAVPVRLGFVEEGLIREREWVNGRFVDHVSYSLLAHEWHARRAIEAARSLPA